LAGCGGEDAAPKTRRPKQEPQCGADEVPREGGGCAPVGVPADACAPGFSHDGAHACDPILPASPCDAGSVAFLGETECHEVAPCGEGTWGDVPVEATTVFVDAAYAGGASDGSMARPWTAVGDAVAAASSGAVVAIAAGSYPEVVTIAKPVRLWGRCP